MAKQCSFCGKAFGVFTTSYDIPSSKYSYCDSHLDFKIRLRNELLEDINADVSDIVQSFGASLNNRHADFVDATSALVSSICDELKTTTHNKMVQEESARIEAERIIEEKRQEELAREKTELEIREMMLTTGYDFNGYQIVKYCDVLFDELIVGIGLINSISASFDNIGAAIAGTEANVMSKKLNEVKSMLRDRIKRKAVMIGANALIGIDFESSTLGDLIVVSMTATAVIVEKKD